MNFTFGIITIFDNNDMLIRCIESIISQNIPEYEILIVGPCDYSSLPITHENIKYVYFDDNIKPGWITKKKNIIAELAKYDNIVLLHDYIEFTDNWYLGMLSLGDDWDVCMNVILNKDGSRFRDWITCDDPDYCDVSTFDAKIMPYHYNKTNTMYASGSFFLVKKHWLLKYPFDETLMHCQGEDIAWSKSMRDKWNYKMNTNSVVQLLKYKNKILNELRF